MLCYIHRSFMHVVGHMVCFTDHTAVRNTSRYAATSTTEPAWVERTCTGFGQNHNRARTHH